VPGAARADCDVGENGVPQEALLLKRRFADLLAGADVSMGPHWANLGGLRPMLAKSGTSVGTTFIGEVLGNPSGGIKQGSHYDGLLDNLHGRRFREGGGLERIRMDRILPAA